jgi:anti-sigma B factor antagonist
VEVAGELDTLTGPLVRERLVEALQQATGPMRIDLSGVSFIDSQGLSALISIHQLDRERPITLAGPRPNIRRLLDVTGLDRIFTVE